MIRAFLPALAMLAVLAANPAAAQDPRLVERLYDPDEVVVIQGKTKVQATIEFGEGEAIEVSRAWHFGLILRRFGPQ